MWAVLAQVQDLGLVLKGGAVLACSRGLNRHSTNLDFDTSRPVELRDCIDSTARSMGVNLDSASRRECVTQEVGPDQVVGINRKFLSLVLGLVRCSERAGAAPRVRKS